MFTDYLKQIGLEKLIFSYNKITLNNYVSEALKQKHKTFSCEEIMELYTYFIPKLTPDGSCSILEALQELPYNLAEALGLSYDCETLQSNSQTLRLWHLKKIIKNLHKQTKVDWLGIYKKVGNKKGQEILLKESYIGNPSRPEFPLTKGFAKHSNNATVGMSGKAVIVESVAKYSGPYYKCDGKVQSEFCLPILNRQNNIIGIIDAESFNVNHFTPERLLQIAKAAFDLGQGNQV